MRKYTSTRAAAPVSCLRFTYFRGSGVGEKAVLQPANKTGYPILEQLKHERAWQTRLFSPPFRAALTAIVIQMSKVKHDKVRSNIQTYLRRELSVVVDPVSVFLFHMFRHSEDKIEAHHINDMHSCRTSKGPWYPLTEHVNWCLIDNLKFTGDGMCRLNCSRVSFWKSVEEESLAGPLKNCQCAHLQISCHTLQMRLPFLFFLFALELGDEGMHAVRH